MSNLDQQNAKPGDPRSSANDIPEESEEGRAYYGGSRDMLMQGRGRRVESYVCGGGGDLNQKAGLSAITSNFGPKMMV